MPHIKEDKMYKQAYVIKVNGKDQYRMFPTVDEARQYATITFRDNPVEIQQTNDYPNSRFINNRALTVRARHI